MKVLLLSPFLLASLLSGTSANKADRCFIHTGCSAGAAWSSDKGNTMGKGWYCLDHKYVDQNTSFDRCAGDMNGCHSGSATYRNGEWHCNHGGGGRVRYLRLV